MSRRSRGWSVALVGLLAAPALGCVLKQSAWSERLAPSLLVSLEKSGEGWSLHTSRWEVKTRYVRTGKVSPDGRLLVLWSADTLDVRRVDTGELVNTLSVALSEEQADRVPLRCGGASSWKALRVSDSEVTATVEQVDPPPRRVEAKQFRVLPPLTITLPLLPRGSE